MASIVLAYAQQNKRFGASHREKQERNGIRELNIYVICQVLMALNTHAKALPAESCISTWQCHNTTIYPVGFLVLGEPFRKFVTLNEH
jgi:hypothetical protein